MTLRVAGVVLLAFFLPTLAAQEECDDSAYIQRHSDPVAPMTPAVPAASFMEVLAAGAPTPQQCGKDMYPFGGQERNNPQCTTSTEGSPFSSSCTLAQFNERVFESTCWWPFQAGTDYCADTFDGKASNQVTLEGFIRKLFDKFRTSGKDDDNERDLAAMNAQDDKHACFTAMPAQLCPKYVCVSAGGEHRNCYETSGKSCQVKSGATKDTVECTDWTVGQTFCLGSLSSDSSNPGRLMPINNFGIQWECCVSGGSTGDPHVSTMDGKHYTMLQEGTFKLWSLSNFSTEYLSSERHDDSVPKMKSAKVDWEVFIHYSTGRSYSKGLLLVDKSLGQRRQALELTSETCRWRSKMGEHGEWTNVERPMPVFMADGVDFVTAFNLSSTGRKNGQMDVRFMMNSKYGIKRVATLKISCLPGHHINSKLRLDKTFLKEKVRGQISPGRHIVSDTKRHGNISEDLFLMRKMSSLQVMQDQEFFVDDSWVNVGGSHKASLYLSEVDNQVIGERSLVTTCSEQAEETAKKTCMKWMGDSIINATGHLRDSFTDCIFDVCAGGGEAAAELAASIMEEDDY